MSVLIGVGVVAVVAAGYVGRKGWLAFHRAVGITPGTLKYVEPAQLPPPPMLQLTLVDDQIKGLPPAIVEQLLRIDGKADIFQQWRNDAIKAGQIPMVSEDEFMVSKLLQSRLPELIESYQRIAHHEELLQQAANRASTSAYANRQVRSEEQMSENKAQALGLLLEVLMKIETKLDGLLEGCQSEALQQMQVMQRYLDQR
ncbi:hypothetical protein [Psychrobacter phenylpyruvicus]|uniref:Uncharacterized protein n=1 Tax=Psychrobacter phenylpyruvicus TaxID=29432 RepID=A0A379LHC9_9GAMM|nr:hypothetical protein [Psychrobacter phenylpyruvicus]SUD90009.1 Uncharacterised protein [Psychrobacter phenylpyruvicus]